MRKLKALAHLVALCAVSLLGLWLAVRGVDTESLLPAVLSAHWGFLALTVVFTVGSILVRAWRWRALVPSQSEVTFTDLLIATGIGVAAVNLLPARLGEVVRAYALRARTGTSVSTAVATLVVERVLDMAAILAALGLVLARLPLPEWLQKSGVALLLADAAVLFFLILLQRYPWLAHSPTRFLLGRFSGGFASRIELLLESFVEGLSILREPRRLLVALSLTLLMWTIVCLAIASGLLAVGLAAMPLNVLTVLAVLSLGLIVPAGPGFVGTFEFFAVFALGLLDVPRTPAVAFALVYHATQFLTPVAIGLLCLWAGGILRLAAWRLFVQAPGR